MRRPFLIALLAFGAVAGFGSGISHMRHRAEWRHQEFERHVAELCVNAARESAPATVTAAQPAAPVSVTATANPAPASPTTVNPTTIYVVPSLVPGYPPAQGYVIPQPAGQGSAVVAPTAPALNAPQPAVPATKP